MAIGDNTSYELFGYQIKDLAARIKSKAEASSLASVATSGLYSDLIGAPTIPTVYNGTLTIQKNGTDVQAFTANSSTDKTANITVPTDLSELAGTISTGQIADGAVASTKINWNGRWKEVAYSSGQSVSIPLDYRKYRISFVGDKRSSATWGNILCPQATGTSYIYINGMSNGTSVNAERSVATSDETTVMDGARDNTASGNQSWEISLSRVTPGSTSWIAMWNTATTNSLTCNTGRSIFTTTVSSGTLTLSIDSKPVHALWVVEAYVDPVV